MQETQHSAKQPDALKNLATLVYALQAAFPFVIPYFIAPLVAYWKLNEARGTWLESHLRWQINTFWFSLAGIFIGILTFSSPLGLVILSATSIWFVFRIGQGWTRLSRSQKMDAKSDARQIS